MKSFSTTSLVGELEKEDRIKELENMLDAQKWRIENQNQRIIELEENEKVGIKIIPMISTDPIYEENKRTNCSTEEDDNINLEDIHLDNCISEEEEIMDENKNE